MYSVTIKNGSTRIVAHEWWTSGVKLANAKISRGVNSIDSFSFDIYPVNPAWGSLNAFSTLVEVVNTENGKTEFEGRVLQPVPSMDSDGLVCYTVTCEGPMGYLCDSTQPYVEEKHYGDAGGKNGLQNFIAALLSVHNSKVEDYKKIYPGNITLQTFLTSSGVTKAIDRASTWDNLKSKLIDVFGGEMRVRRGSDMLLYLDYAEKLGTTRSTALELGRNMIDVEASPDPSAVITRLYPYGAKLTKEVEDEDGNVTEEETEERLTIESVNGGVPYIDDAVAIEKYGIIEGFQEWDDITTAQNLLSAGREWLGENNMIPVSISANAADLSNIGLDYDSFDLYDSYPVRNGLIGLDDTAEIVKQTIDVSDPSASSFEFGDLSKRISIDISGAGSLEDKFEEFQSQANSAIQSVKNSIRATAASIKVLEDSIESTVSESISTTVTNTIMPAIDDASEAANKAQNAAENALSQAQTEMANGFDAINGIISGLEGVVNDIESIVTTNTTNITQLLQDSNGWEFNFQEIKETITQLGDQVNTEYSETLKYIKFIDGEIWLGRDPEPGEDDFKCVISNERIRFMQNNIEVAYISNNKLYVNDAQILNRLDIGNFYFAPRSNGNTTLRFNG